MDILKRLVELQQRYGWTDYKIAKEAGLSPNTVSNIYRRGNTPSLVTLEAISKEYYHYSCGTGIDAGRWFVEHKVKCVAMDMQALDHPLHTAMGNNM